ncbi:hypothetical protein PR202_gb20610 [Eleusine coracana subsp. coracana]|uniref:cytokinin dehydrogenase n=1 Tax=Eleusine coracana subsp. coracana TaxID=191504 RepID=A0AAV5FAV2_ELECO|nr:hypothetical protein PR202_gb20610 [Eleusine coracana subsp. coracana]
MIAKQVQEKMAALLVLNCVLKTLPTAAWPPAESSPVVEVLRDLGNAAIRTDPDAVSLASTDFGNNVPSPSSRPAAVFYPSCAADIAALVRASSASASPFPVSARGRGHSTHGQSAAPGGVVVDMPSLGRSGAVVDRLAVSAEGPYVDAGGEQVWADVLRAALAHGLSPRSWTDYLHLTVGGTLSNAGISGQAFRHGPQISNVLELDVVTAGARSRRRRPSSRTPTPRARVAKLAEKAGGVLYCLEGALYYGGAGDTSAEDADKGLELLLRELRYARGLAFVQDVSYVEFLDRVHAGELKLRAAGLWDVPHPWLNLFLPRSRILDFAAGVFHGVLRRDDRAAVGPVLVYPMNRAKWDPEMSAVLPFEGGADEEEVFYTVAVLRSAVADGDLRRMEEQNAAVTRFCDDAGIPYVQYLPYYATQAEWAARHFGPGRWARFVQRKSKYDPKAILSRGQKIFSYPLA